MFKSSRYVWPFQKKGRKEERKEGRKERRKDGRKERKAQVDTEHIYKLLK